MTEQAKPPTESGRDRRRDERKAAHIEVRFGDTADAARALRVYSINFSAGGLCLKTQRNHTVGTSLHLTLALRDELLEVMGVVAWVRDGAIGVRFVDLSEEHRARLGSLVSKMADV